MEVNVRAESQRYMLDTVIFNRAVDGRIPMASFAGRNVAVTGVQRGELAATSNPERRAQLFGAFEEMRPRTIRASSFALDIEGVGLDQAYWNDGSGNFERMLARLCALDAKCGKRPHDRRGQMRDILIAETAIKNRLY
jgi:predicted nucleic acid-binding protein